MNHEEKILASKAGHLWKKVGVRKHHGINIPLFALFTKKSCGIGEYLDLLPLIDWCRSIQFDVIQLLPLNDTGEMNSPYSALSAFALNPIHLSLHALPNLDQHDDLIEQVKRLHELSAFPRVQYPSVREGKGKVLQEYYQREGDTILSSSAFKTFVRDQWWLEGYAIFKALKKQEHWHRWSDWPEEIRNPTEETLSRLGQEHREEVNYFSFEQFLCFSQMKQVRAHATKQEVLLKGDIPILIDKESVDVWLYRSNFHLDFKAGSPPDPYAPHGQDWGFPIYDWESIEKQDFFWWRERLKTIGELYHLVRLDHIIGFFRIWAIPNGKSAGEGQFIPADDAVWRPHGEKILSKILEISPILPIGEDLGFFHITPGMYDAMLEMGICGTKVPRWYRTGIDGEYIPIDQFPNVSMTTVSTHDFDPLQIWWHDEAHNAEEFAHTRGWFYTPTMSRDIRKQILWESHHTTSLFHVNLLPEYLAYVPGFRWPDIEDERINVPGTVSDRNWSYRCRPSIEEIVTNPTLRQFMIDVSI